MFHSFDGSKCSKAGQVEFGWNTHTSQSVLGRSEFSYFITSIYRLIFSVTLCIHFFSAFVSLPWLKKQKGCVRWHFASALLFSKQRRGFFLKFFYKCLCIKLSGISAPVLLPMPQSLLELKDNGSNMLSQEISLIASIFLCHSLRPMQVFLILFGNLQAVGFGSCGDHQNH